MIKTRKILSAFVALAFTVGMVACDGKEGPAGPAGANGNANVNASIYSVNITDWENKGTHLFKSLSVSEINQDVVNNGAVIVYVKLADTLIAGDGWKSLPYTEAITGLAISGHPAQVTMSLEYGYDSGNLDLYVKNNIDQDLKSILAQNGSSYPSSDYSFKAVIIPSSSLIDGVPENASYEELKQVYNFEEIDF